MKKIACIGAGFSGAVIARELARAGYEVDVFESRNHVAGNCHTERDAETGVMIHVYGPHIFHTSNEFVWNYVQQFDEFVPFINRVKARHNDQIYSLPINLSTINQFFSKCFSPTEAKEYIREIGDSSINQPESFEEQALKFVGGDLYEAFFKNYTLKQWGLEPSRLPASILKRLPVRFDYNDNYYASKYQGIPRNGYTHVVSKILDHPHINVYLNSSFKRENAANYAQVFYSGPIDAWFDYSDGALGYRTLTFEKEVHDGDYQGNPVINYSDLSFPYTRISEHKHFAPWEEHKKTVIYKEFSRLCGPNDIPYYPIRLIDDKIQLQRYIELASLEPNVTFVGRLGTYRYLDMHITIAEALDVSKAFLEDPSGSQKFPNFLINPL